ncbi:MAG: hypothetical protein ACQEXX_25205 [Bacillota bacterium]
MSLEVEVILERIKCVTTGGDDGFGDNELEVRGTLGVSVGPVPGEPRESHNLFRRPDNEGVSIPEGDFLPIQVGRKLIVHPNETVLIGGHLKEDDDLSADDNFGIKTTPFDFHFLNSYPTVIGEGHRASVIFTTEGQEVWADYFLKKIRNL